MIFDIAYNNDREECWIHRIKFFSIMSSHKHEVERRRIWTSLPFMERKHKTTKARDKRSSTFPQKK